MNIGICKRCGKENEEINSKKECKECCIFCHAINVLNLKKKSYDCYICDNKNSVILKLENYEEQWKCIMCNHIYSEKTIEKLRYGK